MTQLALELRPDVVDTSRRRRRLRHRLRLVRLDEQLELGWMLPRTRGDCVRIIDDRALFACPWVGCRHHLFGHRPLAFEALLDDADAASFPSTCALDIANAVDGAQPGSAIIGVGRLLSRRDGSQNGTLRLVDVGRHLGCSGERARQLEADALRSAGAHADLAEWSDFDWFGDS